MAKLADLYKVKAGVRFFAHLQSYEKNVIMIAFREVG